MGSGLKSRGRASCLVLEFAPATWNAWEWFLHLFGAAYLLGFFVYWFRFWRLAARCRRADAEAEAEHDALMRTPLGKFYGKMLGRPGRLR